MRNGSTTITPPLGHTQWPTERAGNVARGLVDHCRQIDMRRCGPGQSRLAHGLPEVTDFRVADKSELRANQGGCGRFSVCSLIRECISFPLTSFDLSTAISRDGW